MTGGSSRSARSVDEFLLRRLRRGERGAWEMLWRRHHPWLRDFAVRALRHQADGEDVAAEALVRTLSRFTVRPGPDSLPAYLRATALNLVRDLVRERDRDRAIGERLTAGVVEAEAALDVESVVVRAAEVREIVHALMQMPERQRYVLIRLLVDDASISQVADELDLNNNATSQLLFRARGNFRRLIADLRGGGVTERRRDRVAFLRGPGRAVFAPVRRIVGWRPPAWGPGAAGVMPEDRQTRRDGSSPVLGT